MHAHAPGVSFKPPGPGREPRSTTWDSSDIATTLIAEPVARNIFMPVVYASYLLIVSQDRLYLLFF